MRSTHLDLDLPCLTCCYETHSWTSTSISQPSLDLPFLNSKCFALQTKLYATLPMLIFVFKSRLCTVFSFKLTKQNRWWHTFKSATIGHCCLRMKFEIQDILAMNLNFIVRKNSWFNSLLVGLLINEVLLSF